MRDVSFDVPGEAYTAFMGRFSEPLAAVFADHAQVGRGQRVLDVGCGPGALTAELVRRCGADHVSAVDPSPPFVAAAAARFPGVEVRQAPAERLPYDDRTFDAALAELVVHFMADPVAGLREMARVTRPGGVVAACVWDHAGEGGPLSLFWSAARALDPRAPDEADLAGSRAGHLADLCRAAGLPDVDATGIAVEVPMASFAQWWEPFMLGVGPAGGYVAGLDEGARDALRAHCAGLLPAGPFTVRAEAWSVRATVPG